MRVKTDRKLQLIRISVEGHFVHCLLYRDCLLQVPAKPCTVLSNVVWNRLGPKDLVPTPGVKLT